MGRKCAVNLCLSDSNRTEDSGVTFHKVPMHSDIRPKWLSLCQIPEDKKSTKVIYICSRHFLRMDFCSYKGRKYMLRQGVLPSVFPWDKTKLDSIKLTGAPPSDVSVKDEVLTEEEATSLDSTASIKQEAMDIKDEPSDVDLPERQSEPTKIVSLPQESPSSGNRSLDFSINSRLEALDFNNTWHSAKVVEEDYEGNEVLIHFDQHSSQYDEWICIDSPRLRATQSQGSSSMVEVKVESVERDSGFKVGERCLASWSDARKFPATVTKVLAKDTYQVLFDDGFVKNLKSRRMCKAEGKHMQSSPLFDPIQSSKQDRRDRKRKINVAELFGKKFRADNSDVEHQQVPPPVPSRPPVSAPRTGTTKSRSRPRVAPKDAADSSTGEVEAWVPQWEDGKPVGVPSRIETNDGPKKSTVVPDPRLPEGWTKHLVQRTIGLSAGKWDTIIVGPEGKRFRAKGDIRTFLHENPQLKYSASMFDFSIHRRTRRVEGNTSGGKLLIPKQEALPYEEELDNSEFTEADENKLKIPIVDDGYQCPIEGCGKIYRRENLAQMHVKHYHPEYTKFLDSTPNVADLAYARTVGESLDKSPGVPRTSTPKSTLRSTQRSTPKLTGSPSQTAVDDLKPQSPLPPQQQLLSDSRDSEIIKLLSKQGEYIQPLPSGLPSNMYPDIKLRDLLIKSEGIPNRDDLNLRALSTTRPPAGIKTLLPVVRTPQAGGDFVGRSSSKSRNKRGFYADHRLDRFPAAISAAGKGNDSPIVDRSTIPPPEQEPPPEETHLEPIPAPNNDVIIEGGQVIKIVRMKQEEIINCTCGYMEEDGLMIQCDLCLCWQHAFCNNIERECQVPDKYICYICQNPARQRMSKKYYHDQEWLKLGTLPSTNFHTKDEEVLTKRIERLKKSHDVSGGLLELKEFVHTLKIKLKIAEAKNHPKLYLWSKPWDKPPLHEKLFNMKSEIKDEFDDTKNTSMLMTILKGGSKDGSRTELNGTPPGNNTNNLNNTNNNNNYNNKVQGPIIPQPEAAINSADCRLNLLEHIAHSQSLVEERLDEFEKQVDELEQGSGYEDGENYPKTRQTLNMLLRDVDILQKFSHLTTL